MRDKEARIMNMRLIGILQKKGIIDEKDIGDIFGEPTVILKKGI